MPPKIWLGRVLLVQVFHSVIFSVRKGTESALMLCRLRFPDKDQLVETLHSLSKLCTERWMIGMAWSVVVRDRKKLREVECFCRSKNLQDFELSLQ